MERIKRKKGQRRKKLGSTGQKILLILAAGASLSLTRRPDRYFNVIKSASKEWQKINHRSLHDAIQRLYQSQLIKCVDNKDGTITLTLTADGEERILNYNLDTLEIKKQNKWDGLWRIVVFDIPESKKRARDALSFKLKNMGMLAMQKSVFVCPYECKDEIDFVVEFFDLKPFVRFIVAKNIDIVLDLKPDFFILRMVSNSALVKTGCLTNNLRQCSGVSLRIFFSGPRYVCRLITSSSRIGSIAGLVTCAKSCLK